jgi:hypothetical protein
MSRYELTISPTYVSDWGLKEGVREFVQNALDQQATVPDNAFVWAYDPETETLRISNKSSVLEPKTLLLGTTTKTNSPETIGQFGEGYKIGTLACIRSGHPVTFFNLGRNEVWNPHFIKSRRFQTEILVFDTKPYAYIKRVESPNLTIQVENITSSDWDELQEVVLEFRDAIPPDKYIDTDHGRVLLDDEMQGKIFVAGLYVCTLKDLKYGYDIPARYLTLDRDRKLVPDFNIKWATSAIWTYANDSRLVELADQDTYKDAQYVSSFGTYRLGDILNSQAYKRFVTKYGSKAIPVVSQTELERAQRQGQKAVLVSETYKAMIIASSEYQDEDREEILTPIERLRKWYDDLRSDPEVSLSEEQMDSFEDIYKELDQCTY